MICLIAGFAALFHYSSAPGRAAIAPAGWPVGIPRPSEGRETLLVFAHPQCPCTRATLAELAQIMAEHHAARMDATVFFYVPAVKPAGWSDSDLSLDAAKVPGVHVTRDVDGELAARFGARTSGQVLFYDAHGNLRFSGGITRARGHVGYNDGHDAINALLDGKNPLVAHSPVFGCSLARENL